MKNCQLCKDNKADKKGSHIVPHFLLKRIENIEGKSGRDYELGFSIGEFNTDSHFGRSVQPEKLEDIYGELSDKEIEENKHPLVVDFMFCSSCETRFSIIESEYAKTLSKSDDKEYDSGIPSELGLLFWASVLWRMSINKKSGVQLTKNENEVLRRILNRCLTDNISNIDFETMRNSKDLQKINYKIFRSPDYTDKHPTFLLLHPKFRKPYTLIINEFVLLFSFKNNFNDYLNKDCFGLEEEVFVAPINQNNSNELIKPIEESFFLNMNTELINLMKTIRVKKLDLFFNKLHRGIGGKGNTMPEAIRKEIMDELTAEEKKLGRKYNITDLRNSTMKVMKKYAP
ncbi:hypothetical protein [Tenacibaculum aiptasiae]|uniref:hypothetical protein n=1 Tax=Tenacibaculum aiptasiae TaxID=426481 RepID=UPI00232F3D44|nr:hypothetical protein [Tenacibaculum aiptasiae]